MVMSAYLHRVPGLLGDEASEGNNVFELRTGEKLSISGERSYIGVLTDYARMPFIASMGYSILALRIPMLLVSIGVFFLALRLVSDYLGVDIGKGALVFLLFSPTYILFQRLGWAITLIPFFILLLAYALQSNWKYKWLFSGLIAGIGLQTHLLFFPSLVAILVPLCIAYVAHTDFKKRIKELRDLWQSVLGFWAGFGVQYALLHVMTEDQGEPSKTTQLFGERLSDLWHSLSTYLSGSSFVAQYTGHEFSSVSMYILTSVLVVLILIACIFVRRRITYVIVGFIVIHTPILLYMVDRYSLRYFVVLSLAVWFLAGIGAGHLMQSISRVIPRVASLLPIACAIVLTVWMGAIVLVPFLRTGGSVEQFSLGNRNTSANAFIDSSALITCLRGQGLVHGLREPIQNILTFYSHRYSDLAVSSEKAGARTVDYVKEDTVHAGLCPGTHFLVSVTAP
jgi:hypothetical protein